MPKNFLTLEDFSPEAIRELLDETIRLKKNPYGEKPLTGKTIAMLFAKSSTRTRLAFEVGINQLGGFSIFLSPEDIQLGRGESLADTATVMSRYVDGLVVRTHRQRELEELAEIASIPVINALTDKYHPCQAVADYVTILEKKGKLENLKLAYIGDGNNVAHSLMIGGAMLGVDLRVATPEGYRPDPRVIEKAETLLDKSGGRLTIAGNPKEAVRDADIIYTDVWISMGHEEEAEERIEAFQGFMVDEAMLKNAKPDCLVMHCLPAHRGEEIAATVLDGPRSIVWDQAENKLHAQKAVLKMIVGD